MSPEEIEYAARKIPCECGTQPAGSSSQVCLGGVRDNDRTLISDRIAGFRRTYSQCRLKCEVCKNVHTFGIEELKTIKPV